MNTLRRKMGFGFLKTGGFFAASAALGVFGLGSSSCELTVTEKQAVEEAFYKSAVPAELWAERVRAWFANWAALGWFCENSENKKEG